MSGSAPERVDVVTASARSLPDLIYSTDDAVDSNVTCTCPPSRSVRAAPPLRYGTCCMLTPVIMQHVPYRSGGAALTDLLGGQVQVTFESTASSIEYIRSGRLRALAVTTSTRSGALPDIPTVSDYVPGYEASSWYGIGAPAGTPTEIIDRLSKEIEAGLADPKIKARLADMGGMTLAGSPSDFRRLIAEETEKWAKVIKFAGIKPE